MQIGTCWRRGNARCWQGHGHHTCICICISKQFVSHDLWLDNTDGLLKLGKGALRIAGFLQRLACGNIELVVFWLHFLQLQKSIVRLRVTPWIRAHTIDKQTQKHWHTDTATQKYRLPGISPHASVDEHIARTVKDRSRTHTHTCARALVREEGQERVCMCMWICL